MKTMQKDDFIFCVDTEKTKAYYETNPLCDCCVCRNFYAQAETISAELTELLSEFGINIGRPDECMSTEMNDYIDYLLVGYTAVGKVETNGTYETDIDDFHIEISNVNTPSDYFPNSQTEPYFVVSVKGISLPWVLDEAFPNKERFTDKVTRFFS